MRIAVIGAGAVGATSAFRLARQGHLVTLFDPAGGAGAAVRGSAGAFAFADVVPMATPGIMGRALRWIADPDGPIAVPPGYAPQIAPWLVRFWRASWRDRYDAALAAQGALMTYGRAAMARLVDEAALEPLLRREGQLQVYEGVAAFRAALPGWEERRRAGVRFDLLETPEAIAAIQPGLAPRFTHAGWTPDWINVTDPSAWLDAVIARAVDAGVRLEPRAVAALEPDADGVTLAGTEGSFDRVVVAAGAWSAPLARSVGLRVPLETERGYNTTLPAGAFDLRTHVTFSDHGFVATRIGDGIRVGGGVELAGLARPPRMARAEAMLRKAKAFLPALDTAGGRQWMGFRPSMPDSLPVIGAAPRDARVVLAFGHGHLGLTQSAATAELVAGLVEGTPGAIDLAAFRPDRFAGAFA